MNVLEELGLEKIDVGVLNHDSFRKLLLYLTDSGASDVYIKSDHPIMFKKFDKKVAVTDRVVLEHEINNLTTEIKNRAQSVSMQTGLKLECDYRIKRENSTYATYRINGGSYNGSRGVILTIRAVKTVPLTIEQVEMPESIVEAHVSGRKGIGFFVGETGSGKSTSLGALVVETMRKTYAHILTIERPIEQIYQNIDGAITDCTQYQVDKDVKEWDTAIHSALRENPDFILVGESRKKETMEAVLTAAESGHSVSTTLHVNRGFGLFQRFVSAFDSSQHSDIKSRLAELLNYVVFQKLVLGTDGKQFAIREYLVLDKEGRAKLQQCSFADVTRVLYSLFERKGQLIHVDILKAYHSGRIDDITYRSLLATYEVTEHDLVGVAA